MTSAEDREASGRPCLADLQICTDQSHGTTHPGQLYGTEHRACKSMQEGSRVLPESSAAAQGGGSKGEWQYRFKRGWKVLGRCTQGRAKTTAQVVEGMGGVRSLDAAFSVGERVVSRSYSELIV